MTEYAARITVKVDPSAEGELGDIIYRAIDKLGDGVQKRAKRVAPVKSGDLRRSIRKVTHRDSASKTTAEIGSDLDYSSHVERGTSKQAAQPYLRPALYQTTGKTE